MLKIILGCVFVVLAKLFMVFVVIGMFVPAAIFFSRHSGEVFELHEDENLAIPEEPIDQITESIDVSTAEDERSSRWRSVRDDFVRRFPTCAACGSTRSLNVHHVVPFHTRPDLELYPPNLITLCREHHFFIGHDPDGPWKPGKPSWSASNPLVRRHSRQHLEGRKY